MTRAWKTLEPRRKAVAERVFDALSSLDTLTERENAGETAERKVGFAELYAFATRSDLPMGEELKRALDESETLRRDLDALLERTAVYHFPRVAAASSGGVESREGEGFSLRIRPSRAATGQSYVIIEMADDAADAPKTLFVCGADQQYGKYPLPDAQNGVIQLLVDSDSALVQALRDVHTEVFIR